MPLSASVPMVTEDAKTAATTAKKRKVIKDQIPQERRYECNCEGIQNGWWSRKLTDFSHGLRPPSTVRQRFQLVPQTPLFFVF